MLQISDLMGFYADINDPLINTYTSRKEEFREMSALLYEPPPTPGDYYKHQLFYLRYLTWYDRMLIMDEPGVGKTCTITASAELFKNEFRKAPDDPTRIREAIILVKGPGLMENIKNEIVCKCTDHIYETESVLRAGTEATMKANITKELNKWYSIMTYHDFLKEVNKYQRPEDLENYLSNKAIYVDEAHNVPTLKDIQEQSQGITDDNPEVEEIVETNVKKIQSSPLYTKFHQVFHMGKRNKIFLFTATPMINSAVDIIPLMNLILPLDQQMPFWRKEEMARISLEEIEPYFRGRIGYVRASITGAIEEPQGVPLPNPGYQTRIYAVSMSSHQYNTYLIAKTKEHSSFYTHQKQASNFVFPDGSYGTAGFNHYIEKYKHRYRIKETEDGRILKEMIANPEQLAILSNKYQTIIDICQEAYPEDPTKIRDDQGIIFVYFADYVLGSGIVMLGLCMKEQGYEEFTDTQSIFLGSAESKKTLTPCTSGITTQVERETRIKKKKRFVLISNLTHKSRYKVIFDTVNSYENRYGEYIQVIIGTKTAREGISINNAVKMIMGSGSWNYSTNFQARTRVFRSTSHEIRLREKEAREGHPTTFPVMTYNVASVYDGDPNNPDPRLRNPDYETVDPHMYVLAEEKDHAISRIRRFAKQSSVNCFLNYTRNVRSTDQDGSPQCDYLDCKYQCTGIDEQLISTVDRTTKLLYYADSEVDRMISALKDLFSRYYSVKLDVLYATFPTIDPAFINLALGKMMQENIPVLDRMGFSSYLREGLRGVIYLTKDPFNIGATGIEETAYTSVLIGSQDPNNNIFEDYLNGIAQITEEESMEKILKIPADDPTFMEQVDGLSIVSKVALLEKVIYNRQRLGETNATYEAIITMFAHTIYQFREPLDLLKKVEVKLSGVGRGRGRPPKAGNVKKVEISEKIDLPQFDPRLTGNLVIVHTLLNQNTHRRTNYGATSAFLKGGGQIRILNLQESEGWRNVNEVEYVVYNALIQKFISWVLDYYKRFEIYGIVIPPSNKLRIRDRKNEDPTLAELDHRHIYTSKTCESWDNDLIIDIMYRLEIPAEREVPVNVSREMIRAFLTEKNVRKVNSLTDDELKYYYTWYQTSYGRPALCAKIRDHLEKTGRIFNGQAPAELLNTPVAQIGSIQVAPMKE